MDEMRAGSFTSLLQGWTRVSGVALFVGFVILVTGLTDDFSPHNRKLFAGISLMLLGIAWQYASGIWRGRMYTEPPYESGLEWGNLFLAILFGALTMIAGVAPYLSK